VAARAASTRECEGIPASTNEPEGVIRSGLSTHLRVRRTNLRSAEGKSAEAEALYRSELAADRASGNLDNLATGCCNWGSVLIERNLAEAETLLLESKE